MANFLKSSNTGILIVRIAVGVLLPFHGYSKLISGIGSKYSVSTKSIWYDVIPFV